MEASNLVELRILNDRGVDAFRNYLADSAALGSPAPRHLLNDNNFSITNEIWQEGWDDKVLYLTAKKVEVCDN